MAIGSASIIYVRTTGSDSSGGGLNVGNANFATDLAATSATGSSPVVTSASYTFVAGDVGYYLFVKGGTNWVPGFYPIASVSAGAATLNAAVGAVQLYGGAALLNTTAGCATTASPTGGTWGMNYAQADAARFSFTDMVIDGTTSTKFTSAANPVGKHMVGCLVNVTGGTGFTVQVVEIVSVTGTTATCDKSLGTLSSTGGTGGLGGGFLTIAKAVANWVFGNKVFVKAGTGYTTTATISASASSTQWQFNAMPPRIIGYTTTPGDGGRFTLTLSTNTGLTGLSLGISVFAENAFVDCNSLGTSTGITVGQYGAVVNCKVSNFKTYGIQLTNIRAQCRDSEVTAGAAGATAAFGVQNSCLLEGCHAHDNLCTGVSITSDAGQVVGNLIANNTGATSDGVAAAGGQSVIRGNTVYGSGRHGVNVTSGQGQGSFRGNLIAGNGGYGYVEASSAGLPALPFWDGNAYWSNTSGTRNNADDLGTTNAQNGVAPYVNAYDVILTADPFVDKASNDFRLNSTAGGGAACVGHGVPTSWPGNTLTTSAPSMGAAQPPAGSPSVVTFCPVPVRPWRVSGYE